VEITPIVGIATRQHQLGEKHSSFGVKALQYPAIREALLETIEEVLGGKVSWDVKEAWLEMYKALSYDMMQASNNKLQCSGRENYDRFFHSYFYHDIIWYGITKTYLWGGTVLYGRSCYGLSRRAGPRFMSFSEQGSLQQS
jgi:hypothetical protein